MQKKKLLAFVLAVFIAVNIVGTITSFAEGEVPAMPTGNMDLYHPNANFFNANVNGGSNPVGFSHSEGVLASNNSTAENASILYTAITGKTQMVDVLTDTRVNIDTLTFVTKTKITITSGADASWKGGSVVLRYDAATNRRLTLRYSPLYDATHGGLRLIGYNPGGTPTIDYLVTQATTTNASSIDVSVVQTKNSVKVYANNSLLVNYTIPANSVYLPLPYSFGLNSVNSICNLSETSLYFSERVDSISLPPMPVGNTNLYDKNADFVDSNVFNGGTSAPWFTHSHGVLTSPRKTYENASVLKTFISDKTEMIYPSSNTTVNINTLTHVTRTHLSIEDVGTDTWNGAGIVIRYDSVTDNRLIIRYQKNGTLMLMGRNGGNPEYLASATYIANLQSMDITVTQDEDAICISINDANILNYSFPTGSDYKTLPYSFGLYTGYSISKLTNTSIYFAKRVNLTMPNLYSSSAGFAVSAIYGHTSLFTHSGGVLSSTDVGVIDLSVLNTAITGKSKMLNPVDDSEVDINTLTLVTKTKLTINSVGASGWNGAGVVVRGTSANQVFVRYEKDGHLRIYGISGGVGTSLADTTYTAGLTEINFKIVQTPDTILVYANDVLKINYTLVAGSVYITTPYAFGLYSAYSLSTLTDTNMYFEEGVVSMDTPSTIMWDIDNGYISGMKLESTVTDLRVGVNSNHITSKNVYTAGGTYVSVIDTIATGMVLKIVDHNNTEYQYTIVVYGDYNGDGKLTLTEDVAAAADYISSHSTPTDAYSRAIDVNKDEVLTTADLDIMCNWLDAVQKINVPLASDISYRNNYVANDQYMVFMLTNTTVTEAGLDNKDTNKLGTTNAMLNTSFVSELKRLFGNISATCTRKYAFGVPGPMLLTQSIQQMQNEINDAFDLAEDNNVPVYFQLDDCTNYAKAYGSASPIKYYNYPSWCEWTAFPGQNQTWGNQSNYRLPNYWFNWGAWQNVPAFPCFESPEFKAFVKNQLQLGVMEPLMKRYRNLIASGKEYLFAGISTGWETKIPDLENGYFGTNGVAGTLDPNNLPTYNGTQMKSFEAQKFGYNALKLRGETTYNLSVLYDVIHDYAEYISKIVYDYGIPKQKIFTHMFAQMPSDNYQTTDLPPVTAAVNSYSTPGYSLNPGLAYNIFAVKSAILSADSTQTHFANAEGNVNNLWTYTQAKDYVKSFFDNGAYVNATFGWGLYGSASHDPNGTFVKATTDWIYNSFQ